MSTRYENDSAREAATAATEYAARRDLTPRTARTGDTPSGFRRFVPINYGNVLEFQAADVAETTLWVVMPGPNGSEPRLMPYRTGGLR